MLERRCDNASLPHIHRTSSATPSLTAGCAGGQVNNLMKLAGWADQGDDRPVGQADRRVPYGDTGTAAQDAR
jgi:hypothetical protein